MDQMCSEGCTRHHGMVGHPCSCEMGRLRGFLEACIVVAISEEPGHGYELLGRLGRFGLEAEALDAGTVYRTLRRLEADGVLESEWSTEGSGAARRVYRVTPEGYEFLRAWQASASTMQAHLREFLDACARALGRGEG